MKKRLFSFALAVLFVLSMLPAGVYATGSDVETDITDQYIMKFAVDTVLVDNDDETVKVSINVTKNGGFSGMTYQLLYDKDALSLEQQPTLGNVEGFEFVGGPAEAGKHTAMLSATENVYGDGTLITYTFKINPDAKMGTHEIKLITSGVAALPGGGTIKLEVLDENLYSVYNTTVSGGVIIPGYVVSYDANGGSGAPEDQKKSKNDFVYISSVRPSRDGYSFEGWATDKMATKAEYTAGYKYSENKDLTLYAVWKKLALVAGSIDINVSTAEAKAGDEVEVLIGVANHSGVASLDFELVFDDTKIKYVSSQIVGRVDYETGVTLGMFGANFVMPNPDAFTNKVRFPLSAGGMNAVGDGDVIKVKFKVLDTAEDGFVDISYVPVETLCWYGNKMDIADLTPNITDGGIEISSQLVGDINLDETVNSDDAVLLLQHLLFGDAAFPIDYKGTLDFNKDGLENSDDAIRLLQYALFGKDLFPIE